MLRSGSTTYLPLDERTFRDVSTLTFMTRFGPFDVLLEPAGVSDHVGLVERAEKLERFGIHIAVASVSDLVAMKRTTRREKDAAHLTTLVAYVRDRLRVHEGSKDDG